MVALTAERSEQQEFSQTHAYLVLELCDLGEMAHYLSAMPGRCLSEDAARYFMQQLGTRAPAPSSS